MYNIILPKSIVIYKKNGNHSGAPLRGGAVVFPPEKEVIKCEVQFP
jgi:hypothetical protein